MIGLSYLAFFLLYLLATVLLTWMAVKAAKRRGVAGWRWGLPVVLVMYLLVFWDWIPTLALHRYYCNSASGYTQYITKEQWDSVNPGVAETLRPSNAGKPVRTGDRDRYVLNQRFVWDIHHVTHPLHIRERDERIVDTQTGEVLARYVDFDTDMKALGLGPRNLRDLKFWLSDKSCEKGDGRRTKPKEYLFSKYMYLLKHQREFKE